MLFIFENERETERKTETETERNPGKGTDRKRQNPKQPPDSELLAQSPTQGSYL